MKGKSTFEEIRKLVAKIPKGKVVTYGDVAKALGIKSPRVIGWAMMGNQDPKVPCHRVIKKNGFLSKNYSLGGWKGQKRRLMPEGITFIGKSQVDMKKHAWKMR